MRWISYRQLAVTAATLAVETAFCAGRGRQAFGRLHQAIKVAIAPALIHAAVPTVILPAQSKMLVLQCHLPLCLVPIGEVLPTYLPSCFVYRYSNSVNACIRALTGGTNQKEYLSHRPSGISPVWLGSSVKKKNSIWSVQDPASCHRYGALLYASTVAS